MEILKDKTVGVILLDKRNNFQIKKLASKNETKDELWIRLLWLSEINRCLKDYKLDKELKERLRYKSQKADFLASMFLGYDPKKQAITFKGLKEFIYLRLKERAIREYKGLNNEKYAWNRLVMYEYYNNYIEII